MKTLGVVAALPPGAQGGQHETLGVRTSAAIARASICLPAGIRGTTRLAVPGERGEKQTDVAYGEQVVPDLGAFCRVNHVEAEPVQEGPLNGLTFSVKDIFDVAGSRTGFG